MSGELGAAVAYRVPARTRRGMVLALVLGFGLALLATAWPAAGVGAALAIGGVVWLARFPHWLWLAFAVSLAIPVQRTVAGLPLNAADGLLVLWCLLWPFMMLREQGPRLGGWRLPTVAWAILPFLAAVVLAQVGSITPGASLKQMLRIVEWFVVLPVLLLVFVPHERFWRLAGVLLMTVPCLFAIDGLVEAATNGRTLTGMLGIPVPLPPGDMEQIRHTFDISGRAGSTFGGAQGLAMYLVMSMSVAIAHILRPPAPWMRGFAIASLLVCAAGLAATQSRGGVLGVMALLFVMALAVGPMMRRFLSLAFVAAGITVALTLLFWPGWDGSIASLVPGRPEAVLDRLILWGVVREVVLAHPFFGLGLGNFRDAFVTHDPWLNVELGYASVHAHNTYLEIAAGTGLVGLAAWLAFLVVVARRLIGLWVRGEGSAPVFTLAAIGTLAAYVVFAMVDMLLLQNMHMLLVMLLTLGLTHRDAAAVGLAGGESKAAAGRSA